MIEGKGTQVWKKSGAIYDGDWQSGLRHGFGTYSVKRGEGFYMKEYAGGWKNDMRHVSFTYNPVDHLDICGVHDSYDAGLWDELLF